MTAPVAGVAAKAVGGKVSRQVFRANRKAAKAAAASAASTPAVTPAVTPAPAQTRQAPKTPRAAKPPSPQESKSSMSAPDVPQPLSSGAGFLLALMFWGWVALPFINDGGVQGVRRQIKAKFTNKAPDGSWLP